MRKIEKRVKLWLLEAIDKTALDGITRDSHIDEFVAYQNANRQKAFEQCYLIINSVASALTHRDTKNLGIYLHIDLISDKPTWCGRPRNSIELIDLIELSLIPELIVYKPTESGAVLVNEFYRSPLYFNLNNLDANLTTVYKEHRSGASLTEEYQRELNIIYS